MSDRTEVIVGMVASAFAITSILFKIISAPAVIAFRLLQGVGKAFTATCCLVMATDALPQSRLGQGIGIFSLAQAMCQAIGPTLGKFIQGTFTFQATFLMAAFFMIAGAVCVLNIRMDYVKTKQFKLSLNSLVAKEAAIPAVTLFTLLLCFSLINSFLYIYAEEKLPAEQYAYIGFYFTIYAVTLLFARPVVGKLTDKYGTVKIVIPAMLIFALSFYILSGATHLFMFYLAGFVSALGYGACQPALNALCMRMVPKERRGAGSCTNYLGIDMGQLFGPTLGGFVISLVGYSKMWSVMTVFMYCGILIIVVFRKKIDSYNGNRQEQP